MKRFVVSTETLDLVVGVWQQLFYLVLRIFLNTGIIAKEKGYEFDKNEVAGNSSCPCRCVLVIDVLF
jgi:hypothetical protein